jgi:hypothetical protein
MAKAWISDWVRLNKDVAEVMLVMFLSNFRLKRRTSL